MCFTFNLANFAPLRYADHFPGLRFDVVPGSPRRLGGSRRLLESARGNPHRLRLDGTRPIPLLVRYDLVLVRFIVKFVIGHRACDAEEESNEACQQDFHQPILASNHNPRDRGRRAFFWQLNENRSAVNRAACLRGNTDAAAYSPCALLNSSSAP